MAAAGEGARARNPQAPVMPKVKGRPGRVGLQVGGAKVNIRGLRGRAITRDGGDGGRGCTRLSKGCGDPASFAA